MSQVLLLLLLSCIVDGGQVKVKHSTSSSSSRFGLACILQDRASSIDLAAALQQRLVSTGSATAQANDMAY